MKGSLLLYVSKVLIPFSIVAALFVGYSLCFRFGSMLTNLRLVSLGFVVFLGLEFIYIYILI